MTGIGLLESEVIPDEDLLYYNIHKNWIREGEVMPGVFRERGEEELKGMSTDWCKYSSPQECRNRARKPSDNGVVHFVTKELRYLQLKVVHAPFRNNPAHTNVKGIDVPGPMKTE
ncbi:hypothetical protein GWO43_27100 [candidate division KSB1 bacterium]|nr:hypothetical protein [candidate division KSB1 bacterium]NIR70321.1 hypothetical protein [candidate division KSB1 bacterium]NIS27625.1 hypothetical protein [candidate division KSB1 bacterium]NIT74465.1 hypothetical protein [candidate division KSB1 bacterium]NIU28990.1 hypothetical protein [candidate division KSB1 bacterium]